MKKILIVDDSDVLRIILMNMISALFKDIEILQARDGQEGLEVYRTSEPCLILCDVQMPIMDGFELLSQIRTADSQVKFVLMSGNLFGDKAKQMGADDFLGKPADLAEIKEKLGPFLE